jgi:hypothetical protein
MLILRDRFSVATLAVARSDVSAVVAADASAVVPVAIAVSVVSLIIVDAAYIHITLVYI